MERADGIILSLLVMCLVLCTLGVSTAGMSADDILKEAKARHESFMSAVKDLTINQEMIVVQGQQEVRSSIKMMQKGRKFRIEHEMGAPAGTQRAGQGSGMPPMTIVVVYDGKDVWTVSPFAGKQRLSDSEAREHRRQTFWADGIAGGLKLLGKEKVASRDAWVIKVEPGEKGTKNSSPFSKAWIDTKNYQLLRGAYKTNEGTFEVRASDFRKVYKDFEQPYLYKVLVNGKLQTKFVTKSIKTNSGLSDDLFDPSKLVQQGPSLQEMLQRAMQDER